ncbi:uncharacterized protein METZ01_LOCUS262272, partial [marine metagenome]
VNLQELSLQNNQLCPPYPECLTDDQIGYQDTSNCDDGSDDMCEVESACNYGEEGDCDFDVDCDGVCGGINWDCNDWALDENLFGSWTAESSIEYPHEDCSGGGYPQEPAEGADLLTIGEDGALNFHFVLEDSVGNSYECQENSDCDDLSDPYMSNYECNNDNECVGIYSFSWATDIPNSRFCLASWWHNTCIEYAFDSESGNFSWIEAEPGEGECDITTWVPEYDGDAPECVTDCPNFDLVENGPFEDPVEFCTVLSSWEGDMCLDDCEGEDVEELYGYINTCIECLANNNCDEIFEDDEYGIYYAGISSPEECEAYAYDNGYEWDGIFCDADYHGIEPGCYQVGG